MHVKENYTYFILANNTITPILDLLYHQLSRVLIEEQGKGMYMLMPILSLCYMLSNTSKKARMYNNDYNLGKLKVLYFQIKYQNKMKMEKI